MTDERRRSPRVEAVGRVHGRLVSLDVPVVVREISLGGMSIETPTPFTPETVHEFLLTLGDGSTVSIAGRARYCREIAASSPPRYLTGLEFVDDEPPDESPVGDVLRKIT